MTAPTPRDARVSHKQDADGPASAHERPWASPGLLLGPILAAGSGVLLVWLLAQEAAPARAIAAAAVLAPLALAGLYRPLGAGSLGLGAFVAPLAAAAAGPAACAWAVVGGAFLCTTTRYRLHRPGAGDSAASRDRRGALRRTADALGLATAAWLASLPLLDVGGLAVASSLPRELLSIALFSGGARLVERLPALGRGLPMGDPPWPREALGAVWDGLGWALGLAALRLLAAGWPALLPVAITLAGLAVIAGVQAARGEELTRSVRELERVVALGATVAPRSGTLASRIQLEIAAILDYEWLELRLDPAFDHPPVLSAQRTRELVPAPATPSPYPRPAAPGIQRRRPWLIVERELRAQDRGLGTVKLWCDGRKVAPADLELLDHLLGQLGSQLERLWLRREAAEDPLTKLVRRKVLEDRLARELPRIQEEGGTLALVVLDLDRFKAINDNFGHLAGDRALSHVAAVVLSELGGDDRLCCRWGGEEFVVLLPGATGEEALEVAEQLRLAVEATAVVVAGGGVITPTISAGVAATPELVVKQEDDLFELADRALYAAKSAGRNRCLRAVGPNRFRGIDGIGYGEDAPRRVAPQL
jgi:diguanylate cyclase (GGDEF)-like protein